jgi:DNA-binding CsgD family transcriptional regulator
MHGFFLSSVSPRFTIIHAAKGARERALAEMTPQFNLQEVRSVCRIVGECCELWCDPDGWQQHFLCSASDLIRLPVGLCVKVADAERSDDFQIIWAFDPAPMQAVLACAAGGDRVHSVDAAPLSMSPRSIVGIVDSRQAHSAPRIIEEVGPDRDREQSLPNKPGCVDGLNYSALRLARGGASHVIAFGAAGRPATTRERRLVELLHGEIAPLIGTRLATRAQVSQFGLSPRLREILKLVSDGSSEKEIVHTLSLTRATVSEHLQRLYRHFGVNGRAELMAYLLAKIPMEKQAAGRKPSAPLERRRFGDSLPRRMVAPLRLA